MIVRLGIFATAGTAVLAILWKLFTLRNTFGWIVRWGSLVIAIETVVLTLLVRFYIRATTSATIKTCGCNSGHHLSGYHNVGTKKEENAERTSCRKINRITIFVARKIVTMNTSWPECKAVAVRGSRVVSVGDPSTLERNWSKASGVDEVVVDRTFEKHVLVPGFIDPHIHPLIGGTALALPCVAYHTVPNPFGQDFEGCTTKAMAIDRIKRAHAKTWPTKETDPLKSCLIAWGWDSVAMGSHLRREDLDKVSTERAVVVWDCSMHLAYVNTRALEVLNVDTSPPPSKLRRVNGVVVENGRLTGQFLGLEAMPFVAPFFRNVLCADRCLKSMHHLTELARQGGVTLVGELLLGTFNLAMEEALFDIFFNDPETPMRCVAVVDAKKAVAASWGVTSWAVRSVRKKQEQSTEFLIYNNGVKFITDDAFLGLTMQMGSPGYIDGHRGIWNTQPGPTYVALMKPFWQAGCRIHVHSNGDAAQDATAEVLAALQRLCPRFDHRFCFEHYGISSEHLTRRIKSLGANVSVNPYYVHHRSVVNVPHIGEDRSHTASRLKQVVDWGVPCAMHTDTPVAPPRPLEEMWIAVNRVAEDGKTVLAPAERIDAYRAMRMKTIDAAYVLGLDALVGSIEPGKFADFTVLSDSPLDVPKMKIRDIRIWGTVVGGRKIPREHAWKLRCSDTIPTGCTFFQGLLWLFAETARRGRGFWGTRWVWIALERVFGPSRRK